MTQNKTEKLCKRFCKNVKVRLVFTSNKLCQTFAYTILIDAFSVQRLFVNLFVLTVMLVMLVKRTNISQPGLIEHFGKDKKSHIYQHLISSADCLNACSHDCFSILDTARTQHQSRIKESLFISWLKPTLTNKNNLSFVSSVFYALFQML